MSKNNGLPRAVIDQSRMFAKVDGRNPAPVGNSWAPMKHYKYWDCKGTKQGTKHIATGAGFLPSTVSLLIYYYFLEGHDNGTSIMETKRIWKIHEKQTMTMNNQLGFKHPNNPNKGDGTTRKMILHGESQIYSNAIFTPKVLKGKFHISCVRVGDALLSSGIVLNYPHWLR